MATPTQVRNQLQLLIDLSNEKTGQSSTDLTSAVNVLIEGFGTGGANEVDVFARQDVSFSANDELGGLYSAGITENAFVIENGKEYKVEWDGGIYTCTSFEANFNGLEGFAIGNVAVVGMGETTGEPFIFGYVPNAQMNILVSSDTESTHKIRVYQIESSSVDSDLVKWVTFMSEDGSTELYKMPVLNGDTSKNPITTGAISTPTKESTAQYNYSYSGWALEQGGEASSYALVSVTEDRTVYASFTSAVRYYTVSFYDGETLLHTQQVAYGSSSSYTYDKANYVFEGWTPEPTNITGDLSCYGSWYVDDGYIHDTWEEIASYVEAGTHTSRYSIGDLIQVTLKDNDGTKTVDFMIVGFDQDTIYSTGNKAGITFMSTGAISLGQFVATSNSYTWANSGMRTTCRNTVYTSLATELKNVLKTVKKFTSNQNHDLITSSETIWIPSVTELGFTSATSTRIKDGQGDKYSYFDTDYSTTNASSKRKRKAVNGTNYIPYPTRSRSNVANYVCAVSTAGEWSNLATGTDSYYAPIGFCV